MSLIGRHSKFMTIILLLVQLCLPLSGPLYISAAYGEREAGHTAPACAHPDADSDHESQDSHQQITHCHVLDAPGVTSSAPVLDYSPVISILTSSDKGALLDGYGVPFDIPPEHHA